MEGRKWEELEIDCLLNVFERLDIEELLLSVPFVCTYWYKASLNPILWKNIDFSVLDPIPSQLNFAERFEQAYRLERFSSDGFVKLFIHRSRRSAVKLILTRHVTMKGVTYLSYGCPELKVLEVQRGTGLEMLEIIPTLLPKWRQLERLYLQDWLHFRDLLLVGVFNSMDDLNLISGITTYLPKLKYLNLNRLFVEEKDLLAILEGCTALEELFVEDCIGFEVNGFIMERASHLNFFSISGSKLEEEEDEPVSPSNAFYYDYEDGLVFFNYLSSPSYWRRYIGYDYDYEDALREDILARRIVICKLI